ncbi:uncharacterized protein KY384_006582 [Bacidia gigantensis]|uniref:uncharacterized protein n=1 Tax=Bacidia gigantensis TaxID=2732470 RepID=UPI001D04E32B|nr:uncharacterized protein KY384_006582 [Bacidia gigantensis]KAG8528893.1 hypothetical protein KY384_006582 [Bacidia gigantensis]
MASFLTWKSLSYILFCILLTHVQALNDTNATGTTDFSAVVLSDEAAFGVCVYPTSGSYSFLSRILYYCTLVFSLFSRTHLWLVVGALASALTYSGAAAIHACLLTWRGPNPYIENDGWSLLTILTTASLITVPLLNWSGTLRRLGAKVAALKDGKKGGHTQSEVGTRTIVVYWALLVLVGFICAWNQSYWGEGETNMEYPEMSKVMCRPGTNASMIRSHNGTLVRRAIDRNFIMQNGCSNPCDQIDIPSIFRQQQDLQLMSVTESLLWNGSYPSEGYKTAEKTIDAQNRLLKMYFYALPFILLQGFITMFFGRRDPREIRDLIYFKMYMERDGRHGDKCECLHEVGRKSKSRQKHECHHEVECQCDYKCRLLDGKRPPVRVIQDWTARVVAFLSYIISVLMVIICPPFFVILVFLHEWGGYIEIPDAEMPKAVGQWSPWAVAGQAICAALIGKYHDKVMIQLGKLYRWIKKTCFHPLLSKYLLAPAEPIRRRDRRRNQELPVLVQRPAGRVEESGALPATADGWADREGAGGAEGESEGSDRGFFRAASVRRPSLRDQGVIERDMAKVRVQPLGGGRGEMEKVEEERHDRYHSDD